MSKLQIRMSSSTSSEGVARTKRILMHTVRREDSVRGRASGYGGADVDDPDMKDDWDAGCQALLGLLNDDPRHPYPIHVLTPA